MISGLNSKLLTEYDGNMQVEVSTKKIMLRLANAFLFSYTTGLGPVLSLEEMILSGVTKFIDKVKIPQGITVKNFSFEGVSI